MNYTAAYVKFEPRLLNLININLKQNKLCYDSQVLQWIDLTL